MGEREMNRKIITEYVHPPIPVRDHDWNAVYEDYYGADDIRYPMGWGSNRTRSDRRFKIIKRK